jgi:hypothetical protein
MPITYEPIATTTLGSAAANFTFSSISQNYTDLIAVIVGNSVNSGLIGSAIRVGNGSVDTGSNYSMTELYGDGSSAQSYRETSQTRWNLTLMTNGTTTGVNIIQIMNYSNTTTYKTSLTRANVTSTALRAVVGLWRSTSAINIIEIAPNAGNWAAGTSATLYGIKAA